MEEKFIIQGTIGQVIYGDVHFQQFCMPGAQVITSEENVTHEVVEESAAATPLPAELSTEKAGAVLQGLQRIGLLDDALQPVGMTWAEKGYLAQQVAYKLGIEHQWKVFGELWHCSAIPLRSGYNRAKDMPKMAEFDEKIKEIVR